MRWTLLALLLLQPAPTLCAPLADGTDASALERVHALEMELKAERRKQESDRRKLAAKILELEGRLNAADRAQGPSQYAVVPFKQPGHQRRRAQWVPCFSGLEVTDAVFSPLYNAKSRLHSADFVSPPPARWDAARTRTTRQMESDEHTDDDDDKTGVAQEYQDILKQAQRGDEKQKQQDHLASIAAANRPLQELLFDLKVPWLMKDYQFLAIRKVAGVPDDWPETWPTYSAPGYPAHRGIMEGDDMGLGKTVMCLAGVAVREHLNELNGIERAPTLIVCPNAAVLDSWREHAERMANATDVFVLDKLQSLQRLEQGSAPRFILVTRRQLQDELKGVFTSFTQSGTGSVFKPSLLAPRLDKATAVALAHKWEVKTKLKQDRTYVQEQHKEGDESTPTGGVLNIERELQKKMGVPAGPGARKAPAAAAPGPSDAQGPSDGALAVAPAAQKHLCAMMLIDEAHELKNAHSLATMLAVAIGLHAGRVVAITGTGYSNHLQDMATLHAIIDPSSKWAELQWWQDTMEEPERVAERLTKKTGQHASASMIEGIAAQQAKDKKEWEDSMLVRRTKKGCGIELPPKKQVVQLLDYMPRELGMSVVAQLSVQQGPASSGLVPGLATLVSSLLSRPALVVRASLLSPEGATLQLGELPAADGAPPAPQHRRAPRPTPPRPPHHLSRVEALRAICTGKPPLALEIGLCGPQHALRLVATRGDHLVESKDVSMKDLHRAAWLAQAKSLSQLENQSSKESAAADGSAEEVAKAEVEASAQRCEEFAAQELLQVGGVQVQALLACGVVPGGYVEAEKKFMEIAPKFSRAREAAQRPGGAHGQRQGLRAAEDMLFKALMAAICNMKMALVHPVLNGKGREMSTLFHARNAADRSKHCAVCNPGARGIDASAFDGDVPEDKVQPEGSEDEDEAEEAKDVMCRMPDSFCAAACGGCAHSVHQSCYTRLEQQVKEQEERDGYIDDEAIHCPRCQLLIGRLRLGCGDAVDPKDIVSADTKLWGDGEPTGGFYKMPKFRALQEIVQGLPADERVLVFDAFKGGLDLGHRLLECANYTCARFDGDSKDKPAALRYARGPGIKALFATGRSGGVGINLQEHYNHVAFMSMDLNPQKDLQAMDRTHRIGQKKEVMVHLLVAKGTFDEAVQMLAKRKLENAEAILDGSSKRGAGWQHQNTKDTVGLLGAKMKEVIAARAGVADGSLFRPSKRKNQLPLPKGAGKKPARDVLQRKNPTPAYLMPPPPPLPAAPPPPPPSAPGAPSSSSSAAGPSQSHVNLVAPAPPAPNSTSRQRSVERRLGQIGLAQRFDPEQIRNALLAHDDQEDRDACVDAAVRTLEGAARALEHAID